MRTKSLTLVAAFISIVVIGCGQDATPPHVTVPPTTSTSTTTTTAPPPTTEVTTTTEAPATTALPVQAAAAAAPVIVVPSTTETAPEPEPEPTVAPAANSGSSAEAAIAYWFPEVYDKAVRIATCESGMTPTAVSPGGGNWGLWQINSVHRQAFEDVTGVPFDQGWSDPWLNSQYARALFDSSGWGPWSCRTA